MSFRSPFFRDPRWRLKCRLGTKSRRTWNCLAFHLVADDSKQTLTFTWSIPWLFYLIIQAPALPLHRLAIALAGGMGERAEYGFWHDYHETKLQWKRIIDKDVGVGGFEKRWVHQGRPYKAWSHETLISRMVVLDGHAWAKQHGIDRWAFLVETYHAKPCEWWIPDLYDHTFTLRIQADSGTVEVATMRAPAITPMVQPSDIFLELTKQLRP